MSHEKELQGVGPTHCPCLSVIMPAYNEEATLTMIVERVIGIPHLLELVIVDDCSSDKTGEIAKRLAEKYSAIEYVRHDKNKGKTEAQKTGFAMGKGDVVIVQDADLEYDPRDYPRLIRPLIEGEADVVYGSRFLGEYPQDPSWLHRLGNGVLTRASNWFTGLRLTDMETCYKAFRRDVLRNLRICQNRFGFEPEVTAKLARRRACLLYTSPSPRDS